MEFSKPFSLIHLKKEQIPKEIGIYAWIERETNRIVYIGSATNKNGLYQRIWNQHLNPNYLEVRRNVFSELDIYQVENPTYHNGEVAIDKSSFRKKIARRYILSAGKESVEYIKEHFLLSLMVYPPDEQENVILSSKMLIRTHNPLFNGRFKKTAPLIK